MSGIAAVSGASMGAAPASAPAASAAGALGAGASAQGAGAAGGASGTSHVNLTGSSSASADGSQGGTAVSSTSVQTSSLISQAQPNANIQNMAALMLSLLLNKSDDSKDKDDPWKMLAGMAMLGAMANQNQGVSMSQSTSVVSEAYSSGGTAAAATGGAVNVQG